MQKTSDRSGTARRKTRAGPTGSRGWRGILMDAIVTAEREALNPRGMEFARRITGGNDSGVVNALDVENARDLLDLQQDFFELLAVADVDKNLDAGVQLFADAFEIANVGGRIADGRGDVGEHSGPVFGENAEVHGKGGFARTGPLNGEPALGFVKQFLDEIGR